MHGDESLVSYPSEVDPLRTKTMLTFLAECRGPSQVMQPSFPDRRLEDLALLLLSDDPDAPRAFGSVLVGARLVVVVP